MCPLAFFFTKDKESLRNLDNIKAFCMFTKQYNIDYENNFETYNWTILTIQANFRVRTRRLHENIYCFLMPHQILSTVIIIINICPSK